MFGHIRQMTTNPIRFDSRRRTCDSVLHGFPWSSSQVSSNPHACCGAAGRNGAYGAAVLDVPVVVIIHEGDMH